MAVCPRSLTSKDANVGLSNKDTANTGLSNVNANIGTSSKDTANTGYSSADSTA